MGRLATPPPSIPSTPSFGQWPPAMTARGRQGHRNGRQMAAKVASETAKATKAAKGTCGRQMAVKATNEAARWPRRPPVKPRAWLP